ncbi:MAG: hypothetical protein ACPGTQ_11695 [Colwellia sp.]
MKFNASLLTAITCVLVVYSGVATADRAKLAKLDKACEKQRDIKLAPLRSKIAKECVETTSKGKEVCEKESQDFNGNRVGRNPMFYDLPECVKAFEYQKSLASRQY